MKTEYLLPHGTVAVKPLDRKYLLSFHLLCDDASTSHLQPPLLPADGVPPSECHCDKQLQRLQSFFLHADTACRDQRSQSEEDLPDVCGQAALRHAV